MFLFCQQPLSISLMCDYHVVACWKEDELNGRVPIIVGKYYYEVDFEKGQPTYLHNYILPNGWTVEGKVEKVESERDDDNSIELGLMKVRFGENVVIRNGEMLYEGMHKGYLPDGKGKVKKGDDVMMDGEFVKGKFVDGTMIVWENNEWYKYDGKLASGVDIEWNKYPVRRVSGNGKWIRTEKGGEQYFEGDIVDNKRRGNGILFEKQNGKWFERYDGEWNNDCYHGKGKLSTKEGDMYEGEFENGKFVKGKLTMKNRVGTYKNQSFDVCN